jgi:hypothetical protein
MRGNAAACSKSATALTAFLHLALQEFLVARYLSEVIGRDSREAMLSFLAERLEDPWWREPILLLAGYQATHAARSARELPARPGRKRQRRRRAVLGCRTGRHGGDRVAGERRAAARRVRGPHRRPVGRRRRAGDIATDGARACRRPAGADRRSRFDPQRFYLPADEMLGFVRIAADPGFMIGTRRQDAARVSKIIGGKVDDDEINDALTPTPEFYIARYPVTVAQFRAFVEATGFAIGDADALADPDSRPVRRVSWHEALAWCDWLNEMLSHYPRRRRQSDRPAGARTRLAGCLAERTRVGESGARQLERQRFFPGETMPIRTARTMRFADQRYVGGRLLCGQCFRSLRHGWQCLGMDAQHLPGLSVRSCRPEA